MVTYNSNYGDLTAVQVYDLQLVAKRVCWRKAAAHESVSNDSASAYAAIAKSQFFVFFSESIPVF